MRPSVNAAVPASGEPGKRCRNAVSAATARLEGPKKPTGVGEREQLLLGCDAADLIEAHALGGTQSVEKAAPGQQLPPAFDLVRLDRRRGVRRRRRRHRRVVGRGTFGGRA